MSGLTGWWSRRSSAAKVELYTRWTFHVFAPLEVVSLGGIPLGRDARSPLGTTGALALSLAVCLHAVLCAVLSSRALDHTTGKRERPVRLALVVASLTAGAGVLLNILWAAGAMPDGAVNVSVLTGAAVFTVGAVVLCVDRVRHITGAVLVAALVTGGPVAAAGNGLPEAAGSTLGVLIGGCFVAMACGFSSWLLGVVQELERSRDLKARLAVAEERLRFGRDLHDVMGRNLSVIALKSELAVQLARRGRPEAVDQMVEVQRIAHESQREVREVVRGYREADLRVELEGARGVLGAAGIDCAVDAPPLDLPDEVQSALGWVVRESTTNVLRHGDARRCGIVLRAEPGAVLLTVENDGAGATAQGAGASGTPAGSRGPGSGLAGLRERLGAVDGTLAAGPAAPHSFRVTARVPLPRAARRTPARTRRGTGAAGDGDLPAADGPVAGGPAADRATSPAGRGPARDLAQDPVPGRPAGDDLGGPAREPVRKEEVVP